MGSLKNWIRVGTLVACIGASSCMECTPGYNRREARDDRGPQVAADVSEYGGGLAFSANGAEVFYAANPSGGWAAVLRAVRLEDEAQRAVDDARIQGPLFPTGDGSALYAIEFVPPEGEGLGEYRLHEGFSGVNPLAEAPPDLFELLALSPSGRRVLGTSQSVAGGLVIDLESGERTPTACGLRPATFSPGSDAVLCGAGFGQVRAVALEGQALPELVAIPDTTDAWAMSWTGGRVLVAFEGYPYGDPVVADPTTGEVVARLPDASHTTLTSTMQFTRDGGALAYVENECLETHGYFGCDTRGELRVGILDLATGEARTIASAGWRIPADGPFAPLVQLALSPDGRTIAYSFGSDLHVRPTGR
jgi:hypothetical protein